ncbi:MAG: inositol monophosphatase family protein [Streptosporangiaceae bacterium]
MPALLQDGRPVLAVIDAPFLGHRYHAIEGRGAYTSTGTSSTGTSGPGLSGTRLSVATTVRLRDAVVAIGDYAVGEDADRKNEARLAATTRLAARVHRIRMLGTAALDLAWVAEGRLDASVTLGNKPWDTSAGVLIVREAGADVVGADGHRHELSSAATIAGPPALIPQLLPLLR